MNPIIRFAGPRCLSALVLALMLGCQNPTTAPATPFATPVGTVTGAPVSGLIGPEGGSVVSEDGRMTVNIPAGALAVETEITITPVTNEAPGGIGSAYRIEPEGIELQGEATISFAYTDDDLAGTAPEALGIGYQDSDLYWRALETERDDGEQTVVAATNHFSYWSLLAGFQLVPGKGELRAGASLPLMVQFCRKVDETLPSGDPTATLLARCESAGELGDVSAWAVNGIPGGNSEVGTVVATADQGATYQAPARIEREMTVAVSAVLDGLPGRARTTIVSNIRLLPDYHGSLTFTVEAPGGSEHQVRAEIDFALYPGFEPGGGVTGMYAPVDGSIVLDHWTLSGGGGECIVENITIPAAMTSAFLTTFDDGSYGFRVTFQSAAMMTCTSPDGEVQMVPINVAAAFSTDDLLCPFNPLPASDDPNRLAGSGTFTCMGGGSKMANWLFTTYD